MDLKYMKVSLFEIAYKKKWTFSRHSNLLRCTCISYSKKGQALIWSTPASCLSTGKKIHQTLNGFNMAYFIWKDDCIERQLYHSQQVCKTLKQVWHANKENDWMQCSSSVSVMCESWAVVRMRSWQYFFIISSSASSNILHWSAGADRHAREITMQTMVAFCKWGCSRCW